LIDGQLSLDAPNIETAAALALVDASGAIHAQIALSSGSDMQSAQIEARLADVRIDDIVIGSASTNARINDLLGVPVIEGDVSGERISAAGIDIDTLALTATSRQQTTQFEGSASLATGADIALAGALSPIEGGYRVGLDRFTIAQDAISARLVAPTTLTVIDENVEFSGVELAVGEGRITATGTAGQNLDVALDVTGLPLSIANTIAPDLGLAGTVNATAQISGPATDPDVQFTVQGAGLNAAAIGEFGVAPLSVNAQGRFTNNTVTLASAQITGQQGLTANAQGTIGLDGGGLDLSVTANAPLSLANQFVADRGAQISGTASLDARITGQLDDPQFAGTVAVTNGDYIDPELAIRLQQITGTGTLSANQLVISSLTGQLATGGSIAVSGTVGLDAPSFTSNVQIALNNARYADGNLLVATLNGGLNLTGPIGAGGQLSGTINIARADITVPDAVGGPGGVIDVDHRFPPQDVAATLARAQIDQRAATAARTAQTPLTLNIAINAPNQIFIRGRGLDAEVGGSVQITGPIDDLRPVGGFELIRGRLSILGQRIDFESGMVTLIGDLDPFIDLVARTSGEGIIVFVTITGRASAPQVGFSSEPMLPEDEVLARLLFNRGVGELSPLQLAQLAAAAAELAGGGGNNSLLNSLRQATGLDDLDIITDDDGNAAVRAGRYIDDNIYLGVEAGASGQSRVTIDLDITDNLRARGATGTDGDSSLGIFYEMDY